VLSEATALFHPARLYHQPFLLADLAHAQAQQGNVEGACQSAEKGLLLVRETRSSLHLHLLGRFRHNLPASSITEACVRSLYERFLAVHACVCGTHEQKWRTIVEVELITVLLMKRPPDPAWNRKGLRRPFHQHHYDECARFAYRQIEQWLSGKISLKDCSLPEAILPDWEWAFHSQGDPSWRKDPAAYSNYAIS